MAPANDHRNGPRRDGRRPQNNAERNGSDGEARLADNRNGGPKKPLQGKPAGKKPFRGKRRGFGGKRPAARAA